jgi:hypothetical protein
MFKLANSVRSTHDRDGAVVLDIKRGQIFNLNPVGSRILELLERGAMEPEIVNVISREFTAGEEVVANDVREFIDLLTQHEILCDQQF